MNYVSLCVCNFRSKGESGKGMGNKWGFALKTAVQKPMKSNSMLTALSTLRKRLQHLVTSSTAALRAV